MTFFEYHLKNKKNKCYKCKIKLISNKSVGSLDRCLYFSFYAHIILIINYFYRVWMHMYTSWIRYITKENVKAKFSYTHCLAYNFFPF